MHLKKLNSYPCEISLASIHNFISVTGFIVENMYLLECHHIQKRSVEPHHELHSKLISHRLVRSAEQQKLLSRRKRQVNMFGSQYSPFQQFQQPYRRPQPQQQAQANYIDLMHINDDR